MSRVETGGRRYRIVILGGGGVGKSSLTVRFVDNRFDDIYDPTIEDSYCKQMVIDDEPAILEILDTAGQEEYSAMREQYIRDGEGFLLVYSITSRRSFEEVSQLLGAIDRCKELHAESTIPIIIAGNKCDLEEQRQISSIEVEDEIRKNFTVGNLMFMETSAKDGTGVNDLFLELVRRIREATREPKTKTKESSHSRSGDASEDHIGCCGRFDPHNTFGLRNCHIM